MEGKGAKSMRLQLIDKWTKARSIMQRGSQMAVGKKH